MTTRHVHVSVKLWVVQRGSFSAVGQLNALYVGNIVTQVSFAAGFYYSVNMLVFVTMNLRILSLKYYVIVGKTIY